MKTEPTTTADPSLLHRQTSVGDDLIKTTDNLNKIDFEKVLNCNTLVNSVLTEKKVLTITLSDPEKHSGGFFTSAYMTYIVTTEPQNFKVKRRYSDFEWLRSMLINHFPGICIPPIPNKRYSDRFIESFVYKRMRFLQVFNNF